MAAEENFDEWIRKADSNCVDKDVTGLSGHGLSANSVVRQELPEEGPAGVFVPMHRFVALKLHELKVVLL